MILNGCPAPQVSPPVLCVERALRILELNVWHTQCCLEIREVTGVFRWVRGFKKGQHLLPCELIPTLSSPHLPIYPLGALAKLHRVRCRPLICCCRVLALMSGNEERGLDYLLEWHLQHLKPWQLDDLAALWNHCLFLQWLLLSLPQLLLPATDGSSVVPHIRPEH